MAEINLKSVDAVENIDVSEPKNTDAASQAIKETKPHTEDVEDVEEFISKDNNVESLTNSNKSPSSTELTVMEEKKVQVEGEEENASDKDGIKNVDIKLEKDNSTNSNQSSLKTKEADDISKSNKSESEQSKPLQPSPTGSKINEIITQEEEKLNEILKIVHSDLEVKNIAKVTEHKSSEKIQSEKEDKEQNKEKEGEEKEKEDSSVDSQSEQVDSMKIVNKDEAIVTNEVPHEVEPTKLSNNIDTEEVTEKSEEQSEVGIVGPPTTASELINEDELRAESVLSTESKTQDHVAEWVQNSSKVDVLITVTNVDDENDVQNDNQLRRKNLGSKASRKKRSNDLSTMPVRKSQRIVTNIIKKSIKW